MIIIIILFSTFMTRSSWNILLQHRTQIDNLIHLHFTSQRLSQMYKTVNFQFRPTLSFSLTKILSWVLIQFLSKESETPCVCVCVCLRETERERENGESKDAISVSLFWISGSLPRDRIATVHCGSLGIGLRDQTLQTVHVDVCSI